MTNLLRDNKFIGFTNGYCRAMCTYVGNAVWLFQNEKAVVLLFLPISDHMHVQDFYKIVVYTLLPPVASYRYGYMHALMFNS